MVCNCEPFEVGGFLCLLFQLLVGCIVKPVQYVVVVEGSYTSGALGIGAGGGLFTFGGTTRSKFHSCDENNAVYKTLVHIISHLY